jgi:hypothetical protein
MQTQYIGAPWLMLPVVAFPQSATLLLDVYTGANAADTVTVRVYAEGE